MLHIQFLCFCEIAVIAPSSILSNCPNNGSIIFFRMNMAADKKRSHPLTWKICVWFVVVYSSVCAEEGCVWSQSVGEKLMCLSAFSRTPWRWCSNACGKIVARCWVPLLAFRDTSAPSTLGKINKQSLPLTDNSSPSTMDLQPEINGL